MAKGAELLDTQFFNRYPLLTSSAEEKPICFPDMVVNTDAKDAAFGVHDHKKPCEVCMGLPGRSSFACYEISLLFQYNKE